MKKLLKLEVKEDPDFGLLGISSHENDYRLVWAINQTLNLGFIRNTNIRKADKKGQEMEFSRYSCCNEQKFINYNLISNRCPDGFLLPAVKNIDFLFHVTGEFNEDDIDNLQKGIKKTGIVSAVFKINPSSIKGVEKILRF